MRKLSGWGHVRYEIRTCLDKLTWISSCQILDTWRFGELCSACGKPYNFGHSRLAYSFSKTSNKTYRLFPQPYVRHWQDAQRRLPRVVGSSMLFFSQDERYSTVDGVWWRSTLVPKMCHDNAWKLKIPSTYPSGKGEPSTPNCHFFWGFHVSFRGCFFWNPLFPPFRVFVCQVLAHIMALKADDVHDFLGRKWIQHQFVALAPKSRPV